MACSIRRRAAGLNRCDLSSSISRIRIDVFTTAGVLSIQVSLILGFSFAWRSSVSDLSDVEAAIVNTIAALVYPT
jgi:hypothetical protein